MTMNTMNTVGSLNPIRVLICEDSAFLRVTLRRIIEFEPGLQVIDIARNGLEAVEKAIRLKPDVIMMDVVMPLMDGVTALKDIVRLKIAPVIMLSSSTEEDTRATGEAMESGAFGFIVKPHEIDSFYAQSDAILEKIKQAAARVVYRKN